jgi:hypothetical protein
MLTLTKKSEMPMPPKVLNRDYTSRMEEETAINEFYAQLKQQEKVMRVRFFATLFIGLFIVGGYFYGLMLLTNAATTPVVEFIGK